MMKVINNKAGKMPGNAILIKKNAAPGHVAPPQAFRSEAKEWSDSGSAERPLKVNLRP